MFKVIILSKWFIGYENKRKYLSENINQDFLPLINFEKFEIILNDTIKFYDQIFDKIENIIKIII